MKPVRRGMAYEHGSTDQAERSIRPHHRDRGGRQAAAASAAVAELAGASAWRAGAAAPHWDGALSAVSLNEPGWGQVERCVAAVPPVTAWSW